MRLSVRKILMLLLAAMLVSMASCVSTRSRVLGQAEMENARVMGSVTTQFKSFQWFHVKDVEAIGGRAYSELLFEARRRHGGKRVDVVNIRTSGSISGGTVAKIVLFWPLLVFGNGQNITAVGDVVLLDGDSSAITTEKIVEDNSQVEYNPQSDEAKRDANSYQISASNIEHNINGHLAYWGSDLDFYGISAWHSEWNLGTFYKGYLPISNSMAFGLGTGFTYVWYKTDISGYGSSGSGSSLILWLTPAFRFGSRVKYGEISFDLASKDGTASSLVLSGRYERLGMDINIVIGDEYMLNYYVTLNGYFGGDESKVAFVPKIGYMNTKGGDGFILEAGINYLIKNKNSAATVERKAHIEEQVSVRSEELPARSESRSETEQVLLESGMIVLDAVYFETGKADIHRNSKPYLKTLAKMLVKYPKLQLEIGGHTDNTGSLQVNMTLSQKRADAVKDFMCEQEPSLSGMLSAKGYGPTEPTADNNTEDGRETNRRVELKVLNPEVLAEYK